MGENLDMDVAVLQKRVAELEYRTSNTMPDRGELKEVLQLMKDFGVQSISIAHVRIEMPYQPQAPVPVGNY